jgi:parallel beta-helix repeat protein
MYRYATIVAVTVTLGLPVSSLAQGSLSPPGAPAPTMKTLEQVEPRTDVMTLPGDANSDIIISSAGSYYMSTNLTVGKTRTYGIYIDADDVTLDLNGFNIVGVPGDEGIRIKSGRDRATLRNGTIRGCDYGVHCYPSPDIPEGCLFEQLTVSDCVFYGIYAGAGSRILDCRAHDNEGAGIYAGSASTIDGCVVKDNKGNGIYAAHSVSIGGCTVYGNQSNYGIRTGDGATIDRCTVRNNEVIAAIYTGKGATVNECAAYTNVAQQAIRVGDGSTVRNCSAIDNVYDGLTGSSGIKAESGCTVIGCTASGNTNTDSQPTVNKGTGISVYVGSTVKDCAARANQGDGILVVGDCLVTGNTCDDNGVGDSTGAGIHATTSNNRIDGNNVTDNDTGIDVDGTGNLVVRNSAAGNTINYDIVPTNKVGMIISPADCWIISGDSGGGFSLGTLASDSPWVNFVFDPGSE